jgi:hypothetical protein
VCHPKSGRIVLRHTHIGGEIALAKLQFGSLGISRVESGSHQCTQSPKSQSTREWAQGHSRRSCGKVGTHREEPQPSDGKKARSLIRVGRFRQIGVKILLSSDMRIPEGRNPRAPVEISVGS